MTQRYRITHQTGNNIRRIMTETFMQKSTRTKMLAEQRR